MSDLARTIEALLFLSAQPVTVADLAEATHATEGQVEEAVALLGEDLAEGKRGIVLREVSGGLSLASDPAAEDAARRLLAKPRTPPLTQAQAETLAIVAYLQPVSRPDISRIRGVAAEAACASLVERGMIEEAGRSQFGAVLYRTTGLFLKLFGLEGLADLPDPAAWDPTPEEEAALRERLLRAGDARAGNDPTSGGEPASGDGPADGSAPAAEQAGSEAASGDEPSPPPPPPLPPTA